MKSTPFTFTVAKTAGTGTSCSWVTDCFPPHPAMKEMCAGKPTHSRLMRLMPQAAVFISEE